VYSDGKLKIRIVAYFRVRGTMNDIESDKKLIETISFSNLGDDHLRWRGLKYSADGGIGSLEGAISKPYLFGKPNNLGYFNRPENIVVQLYELAADHGWELHTHATGD
jgi:predicted amidohydrolase YtcJ